MAAMSKPKADLAFLCRALKAPSMAGSTSGSLNGPGLMAGVQKLGGLSSEGRWR
jgi:hypothetical protein